MVLYGHNKPLSASEFFRKVSVEKRNLKMWNILHENRTTQIKTNAIKWDYFFGILAKE